MTCNGSLGAFAVKVNGKNVRLECGDLTALPVEAIVFYAREDLQLGSGFGGAIRSRGGAAVEKELGQLGCIGMGEAVVTTAGAMQARYLIHACGPKFQEPDLEGKLRRSVSSALEAAADRGVSDVAFPPMGAGFYGIPLELCATVMLGAIRDFLRRPSSVKEVVICVRDGREFRAFQPKLAEC
jgi:O-acetyl-ADP-ribose deacetylase (regulator of RNase III)